MGTNTLIWKPVKGYDSYEASNTGLVRNKNTGRLLKSNVRSGNGYLSVTLYNKGLGKSHYVHRLVALAHCEGHFLFAEVNHIDCDKGNNHFSNLEWCSPQANHDHKVANGLTSRKGLTSESDKLVKSLSNLGHSVRSIQRLTGISRSVISRLIQ